MRVRISVEPQQGATYGQILDMARLTEAGGFDAFFRSDHYLTIGEGGDGLPGPSDAWATLAALARDTGRVRLGTLVTSATFRLPGILAITVAQVDEMSEGRIELGLGAGWYESEHSAYGIPFPALGERIDRLEEQFEIITGLWATPVGKTFTYAGRHYRLTDSPGLPKPLQQPHPPLIVGGGGPKRTPRLAARFADEYNAPFKSFEELSAQYDRVRSACTEIGRDPSSIRFSVAVPACCGTDEAEFVQRAAAIGREPEALRARGAAGLPEEVIERLRGFGAAGADTVYLQIFNLSDVDHIRLISERVLPEIA